MNPQTLVSVNVQVPAGVTPPDADALLAHIKKSKALPDDATYMVNVAQVAQSQPPTSG